MTKIWTISTFFALVVVGTAAWAGDCSQGINLRFDALISALGNYEIAQGKVINKNRAGESELGDDVNLEMAKADLKTACINLYPLILDSCAATTKSGPVEISRETIEHVCRMKLQD